MSNNILDLLHDALVIGYLFVLRIGVPLLITLLIGQWLHKLLEPKPPVKQPVTRASDAVPARLSSLRNSLCRETVGVFCRRNSDRILT